MRLSIKFGGAIMNYIYAFAEDQTLTNQELGGKGANLAEMTRLG